MAKKKDKRRGWLAALKVGDKVVRFELATTDPAQVYSFHTVARITPTGSLSLVSLDGGVKINHHGIVVGSRGMSRLLEPTPELVQRISDLHERLSMMGELMEIFGNREFMRDAPLMPLSACLKLIRPAYAEYCNEGEEDSDV